MDARELRALQAPPKERYKESRQNAVTPARAEAVIEENDISCEIYTYAGTTIAGLHPATGGDGAKACLADMMKDLSGFFENLH